jgi:BioD-like phosphotransacetylase family protein
VLLISFQVFGLSESVDEMCGVHVDEAMAMLAQGKRDELLDRIVEAFERYKNGKDFVVISGYQLPMEQSHAINALIATVLRAPIVLAYTFTPDTTVRHC